MPTLETIAHGKEGRITYTATGSGGGCYGANCFDVSYDATNATSDVTTFDSPTDFTETIPGKTTATGSFSVYVDDATVMGIADLHFDTGGTAPAFPALAVVLGVTTVTMAKICITTIGTTQDPNGVPAFVCSYVSVGTITHA